MPSAKHTARTSRCGRDRLEAQLLSCTRPVASLGCPGAALSVSRRKGCGTVRGKDNTLCQTLRQLSNLSSACMSSTPKYDHNRAFGAVLSTLASEARLNPERREIKRNHPWFVQRRAYRRLNNARAHQGAPAYHYHLLCQRSLSQ